MDNSNCSYFLLSQANQQVEDANKKVEALKNETEGKLDTSIFDKSKVSTPEKIEISGALATDIISNEPINFETNN